MPDDPYASFSSPTSQADPYAAFSSPVKADPSDWQSRVKPVQTHTGRPSVQREDGAVWYGPEQGNTGKPGWFDAHGNRMGDAPGKPAGFLDRQINKDAEWNRHPVQSMLSMVGNTPFMPSLGGTVRTIRGAFTDTPLAIEKYLPDPTNAGVVKGLMDAPLGIAQGIAHATGLGAPAVDRAVNTTDAYFSQNYVPSKSGEMYGQAIPFALSGGASAGAEAPQALSAGQKAWMIAKGILKGSGTGAVMVPALTPEVGVQSDADYLDRKKQEAQTGALIGGAIPATVAAATEAGPLAKAVTRKALVGKYGPEAERILAETEAAGSTMKPSEVLSASRVSTQPESVGRAKTVMEELKAQLGDTTRETPYRGLKRLQDAANSGDRGAKKLIERIKSTGENPTEVAQTSGAVQAERARLIKNKLWADVDANAGPKGVPLPKTYDVIQNLREEMAAKGEIPGLSKELDRLERYFPQMDPETGRMMAPRNPEKGFGKLKMDAVQRMNDILSGVAEDADSKALQRAARELKGALEGDMEAFAKTSPNPKLWASYERANKFHKEVFAPTTQSQPLNIQNLFATDSASNPAYSSQLLSKIGQKSSGADRAADVANVLGPKGRAAFAQSIVETALSKVDPRTGVWIPGGSASELAGRMDTIRALIPKGPDRMKVEGALNLLQHLAKASPENASALGERFAQVADAGSSKGNAALRALRWLHEGGLDVLFNSPKGKEILFKASSLKPGTNVMESLMKDFPKVMVAAKNAAPASNVAPLATRPPAAAGTPDPDQTAQYQEPR